MCIERVVQKTFYHVKNEWTNSTILHDKQCDFFISFKHMIETSDTNK